MWRSILFASLVLGCGGGRDEGARTEACERMRDHLVELRLDGNRTVPDADLQQHRAALVAALGPQFIGNCVQQTSDEELDCLSAAANSEAARACAKSDRAN